MGGGIRFLRIKDLGPLSRTCTALHQYANNPIRRSRIRKLCLENSTNQITAKYEKHYEVRTEEVNKMVNEFMKLDVSIPLL